MRFATPVVFTDDDAVAEVAAARGWKVIQREDRFLRFAGLDRSQTVAMPEDSLRIDAGSLEGPAAAGWDNVLNWLQKHIHHPMPIVAVGGYASQLALWAAASRGWPFGVIAGDGTDASPTDHALRTGADGVFSPDGPEAGERGPELPDTPLIPWPKPDDPKALSRDAGRTNVLVVSYEADHPRALDWFTTDDARLSVDLATATQRETAPLRIHRVRDLGPAALTDGPGPLKPWAASTLAGFREEAYPLSEQPGGYWLWQLERYFDARQDHFDVVVLVGPPSAYFDFARYAKRRWYAQVVLDYGDARTDLTAEQRAEAEYQRAGWDLAADVVLASHKDLKPARFAETLTALGDHTFQP